jgi:hypothetical protein
MEMGSEFIKLLSTGKDDIEEPMGRDKFKKHTKVLPMVRKSIL